MDAPRVVTADEYRRERWRNGAGWTRQVHAEPGADGGDGWAWRLSIAEIEADAPFSSFPGVDRELVLLEGEGLRLRFEDGDVRTLLPPHDRLRFAGERALSCELIEGPTRDFNVMWRRDAIDAQLWHRPLVGSMAMFVDPGSTWAVYLMAGQLAFDAASGLPRMRAGDTALLPAAAMRRRYLADGGGEALVIRFTTTPATAPAATPGSTPPSR